MSVMVTRSDDMSSSPALLETEEANNLGALLEELGGISPDRIIVRPPPGTATEDDVIRFLEAPRKRMCELIDGVLVEKPMGWRESILASFVISSLQEFSRPRNLGFVAAPDGTIRLWPGRVRIPDVAFVSWDRVPGRCMPDKPIPESHPILPWKS